MFCGLAEWGGSREVTRETPEGSLITTCPTPGHAHNLG